MTLTPNAPGGHVADELLEEARRVLRIVERQGRRPYVVELTGTPKAGKSSSIRMLAEFFRDAGWSVHVVRERAELCPLAMKGHFFFNTWTTCTMLAELVDRVDRPDHLVILDRGLFDALVWLRLQEHREQVEPSEAEAFRAFVGLERWRRLQDMTLLLQVDPEVAMRRENQDRLVPRQGTLMTPDVLGQLNRVIEEETAATDFGVTTVGAGGADQKATVRNIVGLVLERIEGWADPVIAVVARSKVDELFQGRAAVPWDDGAAWEELRSDLTTPRRSHAEDDDSVVQIVAAGVHTVGRDVFVFDRDENDEKATRYGRRKLWMGAHVDHANVAEDVGLVGVDELRNVLRERLESDLHLSGTRVDPEPLGLVWDPDKEPHHLGVVFRVPIENTAVAEHMDAKKLRSHGRATMRLELNNPARLLERAEELNLEPWSRVILQEQWLMKDRP